MMRKRPKLYLECGDIEYYYYDDEPVHSQNLTIHEDEWNGDSGLLDADGNPLGREKPRIGFI